MALALVEGSADDPMLAKVELLGILSDDEAFHDRPLEGGRPDGRSPEDGTLDEDDFVCFENEEADILLVIVVELVGSMREAELLTEAERSADDTSDDDVGISELALALEGDSPVDEAAGDMVANFELPAGEDVVGSGTDQNDSSGTLLLLRGSEVGPTRLVASEVLLRGEVSDGDIPDGTSNDEDHDPLGHGQEPGQVELD
ncbi:hypothetical protein N0V93_008572 [Gnomoniopsis smithogilvyi]|uniref:Uncharacterized protein n=1 Tax=Gnomoniopsis smithogilvyi TaxID=1191159 RepID=A0A9W8YLY7_9PEZI|nr:hypothetical protein N0V93_008572 [Gnomoniopsis smithogilvyi]